MANDSRYYPNPMMGAGQGNPWYNPYSKYPDVASGIRSMLNQMWMMKLMQEGKREQRELREYEKGVTERRLTMEEAGAGRQAKLFEEQMKEFTYKEEERKRQEGRREEFIKQYPDLAWSLDLGIDPERILTERKTAGLELKKAEKWEELHNLDKRRLQAAIDLDEAQTSKIRDYLKNPSLSPEEKESILQLTLSPLSMASKTLKEFMKDKNEPDFINAYEEYKKSGLRVDRPVEYSVLLLMSSLYPGYQDLWSGLIGQTDKPSYLSGYYNQIVKKRAAKQKAREKQLPLGAKGEGPLAAVDASIGRELGEVGRGLVSGAKGFIGGFLPKKNAIPKNAPPEVREYMEKNPDVTFEQAMKVYQLWKLPQTPMTWK